MHVVDCIMVDLIEDPKFKKKKKTTKNMLNTHPSHAYLMERPHGNHDPTQVPLDSVVAASKTDAGRLESCEDALVQHGEIIS